MAVVGNLLTAHATMSDVVAPAGGHLVFRLYHPTQTCGTGTSLYFSNNIPVTGNVQHNGESHTATAAGTWQWSVEYVGNANNASIPETCGPTVEVAKATPTLSVTANPTSAETGATLHAGAGLSNGYNPGNDIRFRLYAPGATCGTGTPAFTTDVTVAGNGNYDTSEGHVATIPGTWRWTAEYLGDGNNAPITENCASAATVVVSRPTADTTLSNLQAVNSSDTPTATFSEGDAVGARVSLAGGDSPTGAITFTLHTNSACSSPASTPNMLSASISGNGTYTSSSTLSPAAGTYWWHASYPGEAGNNGDTLCGGSFTVNEAPSAGIARLNFTNGTSSLVCSADANLREPSVAASGSFNLGSQQDRTRTFVSHPADGLTQLPNGQYSVQLGIAGGGGSSTELTAQLYTCNNGTLSALIASGTGASPSSTGTVAITFTVGTGITLGANDQVVVLITNSNAPSGNSGHRDIATDGTSYIQAPGGTFFDD